MITDSFPDAYNSDDDISEENWRNKNPPLKKRKINKSNRSKNSILNKKTLNNFCKEMPLLVNGFCDRTGKKTDQILNACAFDSLF